jgi:hypothetical protein
VGHRDRWGHGNADGFTVHEAEERQQRAFDYGARTARAPEWLRPHVPAMHTAMQLESIERRLRRPLVADDPPLQVDELPPPRRRAVA